MNKRRMVVLLGLVTGNLIAASSMAEEQIDVPPGQRQLFLDEHTVAAKTNLSKTTHQPAKKGAVIRPDQPWEKWLETRCAPAWDEKQKIFKIWMLTVAPIPGVAGTTYAESADGIHWTKPMLRQSQFQGSLENNFVTPDPKLSWNANAMENVVYDPHDPDPARRYKGFLGAEDRRSIVSPDGIRWTILDAPKLPSMDESNLSYDAQDRVFIATTKVWGPLGRSHAIWTSKDFHTWTRLKALFEPDQQDQLFAKRNIEARRSNPSLRQVVYDSGHYHADFYNVGISRYEGCYIAFPAVYHATSGAEPHTDGFDLIELACSRDLQTWQWLPEDRRPFIEPSPTGQGAFDLTQILPPSAPVVRGDELWFYYTGMKYREIPKDADPEQGAICLAILRRDGFVSLDADRKKGMLLTKPFEVRGTRLFVNLDAGKGSLKVEALDRHRKVVAVSETISGDHPHAEVSWKSGDFSKLKGQTARLRFTLQQAQFYSFWLED